MKAIACILFFLSIFPHSKVQEIANSPWHVVATEINPSNYYGVTIANGMIGILSSPEPLKVRDVVLNGVYDNYQRGRVSNILKSFNHVSMNQVRLPSRNEQVIFVSRLNDSVFVGWRVNKILLNFETIYKINSYGDGH
jgi:hypothetical protein